MDFKGDQGICYEKQGGPAAAAGGLPTQRALRGGRGAALTDGGGGKGGKGGTRAGARAAGERQASSAATGRRPPMRAKGRGRGRGEATSRGGDSSSRAAATTNHAVHDRVEAEHYYIGESVEDQRELDDDDSDDGDSSSASDDSTLEQMRVTIQVGWGQAKFPVRRVRRGFWQGSAYFSALSRDAVVIGERASTRKEALHSVLTHASQWVVSINKRVNRGVDLS